MSSIYSDSSRYEQARIAFLRGFIGFLVLTALVAVITVIQGEFGDLQAKILGTSLTISIASVCSLSSAAYLDRGGVRWAGLAGIVFAFAGGVMLMGIIWFELTGNLYVKSTLTLIIGAFSFAHALLLLLPNLRMSYQWIQKAMIVSVSLLALMGSVAIWLELESDLYFRVLIVVAIAVGLQTIVIPLLLKIQTEGTESKEGKNERLILEKAEDGTYHDSKGDRYSVEKISPEE
ncbi:MAG: hypothetical protein GVY02_03180 [Bacteroidetes bacterium]|jgi:hypothetical protein|nr:hypothetical protein [Bacteroidota bacterium]